GKWLVVVMVLMIVLMYIFYASQESQKCKDSNVSYRRAVNSVPKILAWTPYFSSSLKDRIMNRPCPYQCNVYNSSELSEEDADVIIFHFRDVDKKMPIPKKRRPDQIYVSFLKEAPIHAGNAVNIEHFAKNFFNSTVDYRVNNFTYSDLPIIRRVASEKDESLMRPLSEEAFEEIVQRKTESVLAVISNCHAESKRMNYIKELSKHINITTMGGCFGKWRSTKEVEEMIKSHFFVIAFENIVCKDYATEKFFRIRKDIVPIVLRRRIMEGLAPSSSFVAADDYSSPRDLAAHLKSIVASREEYRKCADFDCWPLHCDIMSISEFDLPTQNRQSRVLAIM
ncbi:hypothetical protein PMAYCL1PPCAC_09277, partial [Pristionchus mayeri]